MLLMMIALFGMSQVLTAYAQISSIPSSSSGVVTKICPQPPSCFATKEAKQNWAKKNKCQFLEDVCEKTPASQDNKGAKPEDEGFWGSLWNDVKGGLVFGYEFLKGVLTGLKDQISDVIDLITNPSEVFQGLVELGKAFVNDPKGTLTTLGELLGQEAIDTITKATQCGAYDLGKVVGSYVSPAIALKLATRLTKFSGNLKDAVKATKHDIGCASFAAGTLVLTSQGMVPIESIAIGEQVLSRHERSYADVPQAVTNVFGRIAPSYRLLKTESDTLKLTDEHPLWVQGKGWLEAKYVTDDDVISGYSGDERVLRNEVVNQPLKVYNFSVANTPNYFVGNNGVWVHNANCDLPIPYRAPKSPSGYKLGATDGHGGVWATVGRGNEDLPSNRYQRQITGAPHNIEYRVGVVDFDGYDSKRGVFLDAKNFTANNLLVKGFPPAVVDSYRADVLKEARRQLGVLNGTGANLEWHISNRLALDAVKNLFDSTELRGRITLVFSPDLVN